VKRSESIVYCEAIWNMVGKNAMFRSEIVERMIEADKFKNEVEFEELTEESRNTRQT